MNARLILATAALVAAGFLGLDAHWRASARAGELRPSRSDAVVFVVLDTVRADHTSLCGYERPTTPTLARLAREGAAYTCQARTPGSWTLPSHASYFTGKRVLEHGAHELPVEEGVRPRHSSTPVAPLALSERTLAERFKERGYQTFMLAENPVLSEALGFTQGFDTHYVASSMHAVTGDRVAKDLERRLRASVHPKGGPLFLFVNITDAHGPWSGVPRRVPWSLPRQGTSLGKENSPESNWYRFFRGVFSPEERKAWLESLVDNYDFGIFKADQALNATLKMLRKQGWCGADCRIVITSDHGELLGEHDTLHHGWNPWEENSRVPLMVIGGEPVKLPEPMNALHVYDLVLNGALPSRLEPVAQVFWKQLVHRASTLGKAYAQDGALLWEGQTKYRWLEGQVVKFDLAEDPGELRPQAADAPAHLLELARGVEQMSPSAGVTEDVMEALKAAGYME